MQSFQIVEHGKPLQSVIRETPKAQGNEILVRVTHSGVCHSDLHIWDGYFELGAGKRFYVKDRGCVPPFTIGHEPFGKVVELGSAVAPSSPIKVGSNYIVYPWQGCGECAVCKDGDDNYCLNSRFVGIMRPGAYTTHLVVPDERYLVNADGIDPAFACTLACSGLTVFSAIKKLAELRERDWVVVLGCGGLGLIAVAMLKAIGISQIIACDIDAVKLQEARTLGAAATVNTLDADAAGQLAKIGGGNVVAALDFVGMPATATLGIAALRKGGRYVLCGLFGGEITLPLPPIAQRAISIVGSYVGNLQELRDVVALAKSGKLKQPPIEVRAASEANRSLEELKAGKVLGRIVLDFGNATE